MSRSVLTILALGAVAPQSALACGGFFCSTVTPVDQAAEEILFAMDGSEVTMHVKIAYDGPAEDFSWVVPVATEPTLSIGTDSLFTTLSGLRAAWALTRDTDKCSMPSSSAADSAGDDDDGGGNGVTIISTGAVGPYEQVTLLAQNSDELTTWLTGNNFDIPADFNTAIAPYVAAGQYFVALRLAKNKDAGDLEPIVLTYQGDIASIPIQLTAVAATPDMGLRVYVLGDHRAVPESYLHVKLNHLAINWWRGGDNVDDAIGAAADEAGGHAFFTDYSGSPSPVQNQIFQNAWDNVNLAGISDAEALLLTIAMEGLPIDDPMLDVLSEHMNIPVESANQMDLTEIFGCMNPGTYYGYTYSEGGGYGDCYSEELALVTYDPVELAAGVELNVLEPRRRTELLLASHPKITRMTSSVSPGEMTVDPTFVFNPDMADVAQVRNAIERYECGGRFDDVFEAPREVILADGRNIWIPSMDELGNRGLSEFEWLEANGLTRPAAALIEQTSASGQPEVLVDNSFLLDQQIEPYGDSKGCGCNQGSTQVGWLALLPLLLLRRRDRVTARR